jgi:phosphatidylglycerophosphate synthase
MPTAQAFTNAKREHHSLLASIEKKALIWMAERMPRWVNSDHLTALGFVALIGIAAAYYWARSSTAGFTLATVLFVVNWFGDSLDGTLARVRNQQRPRYGFYIDHVLDTCGSVFVFGGLALSGYMSERVALALLVAWLLLSVEIYLATYTLGTFHLSFAAFGPTEFRLLMIAGNIAVVYRPVVAVFGGHYYLLFDVGGVIGAAGMLLAFVWSAVKHGTELYRAETLR